MDETWNPQAFYRECQVPPEQMTTLNALPGWARAFQVCENKAKPPVDAHNPLGTPNLGSRYCIPPARAAKNAACAVRYVIWAV